MSLRSGLVAIASLVVLSLPTHAAHHEAPESPPSALAEFLEFVRQGTLEANIRARWENARIDNLKVGNAATLRTQLGYGTKPWKGFSVFAEFENITSANDSIYFDGVGANTSGRTIVADPNITELNQAYGNLALTTLGSFDLSETKTSIRGGRQTIVFDDSRHIGNVIWRQNEQTYDAVKTKSSLGIEGLETSYTYVFEVRRIFGDLGAKRAGTRNFGGDSHFVRVAYDEFKPAKMVAFAYLLDFGNGPSAAGLVNSSNTYGFRVTGAQPVSDEFKLVYAGSYAYQTDAGDNPASYDTNYGAVDLGLAFASIGTFGAGYEVLGSDNKNNQFLTPLATAHKFNGWADAFLDNGGPFGLRDAYGYFAPKLPWGFKGRLVYHQFYSDTGTKRGTEFNAIMTRKIFKYVNLLAKFAWYKGQNINDPTGGRPDRYRLWLEATFAFKSVGG